MQVVYHFRLIWKAPLRSPLLLVDIKESIYMQGNLIFLAIFVAIGVKNCHSLDISVS